LTKPSIGCEKINCYGCKPEEPLGYDETMRQMQAAKPAHLWAGFPKNRLPITCYHSRKTGLPNYSH